MSVMGKRGTTVAAKIQARMREGYHCNSNTPSDEYLIPLKLTWTPAPLEVTDVVYPKAQMEKYSFSKDPLSVYTGDFEIVTHFKVPASAALGGMVLPAKLRYQACNDETCLPPRTVPVTSTDVSWVSRPNASHAASGTSFFDSTTCR